MCIRGRTLHRSITVLAAASALTVLDSAWAGDAASTPIFWSTDSDGSVHLSNVPTSERFELLIDSREAVQAPMQRPVNEPQPAAAPSSGMPAFSRASHFDGLIEHVARAYALETALLKAVITVESAFNPKAVSVKGATGLMQLMPATAKRYGVANPFDVEQNLNGGARYLRDLLQMFGGDLRLALAAYNAGEHSVMRYGFSVPPFRETQNYVPRVLDAYQRYRGLR